MYQQRYWSQLRELRTHVFYLHFYASQSEYIDKAVNIFLALTSSVSIAAWAIWKEHQMLWATIIATSQVITAIKPFLPYRQRVKIISDLNDAIQTIALESEKHWFCVAEGHLTEEQIHEKYIELANMIQKAEQKCLGSNIVPHRKKLLLQAEVEADKYLTTHYQGA